MGTDRRNISLIRFIRSIRGNGSDERCLSTQAPFEGQRFVPFVIFCSNSELQVNATGLPESAEA